MNQNLLGALGLAMGTLTSGFVAWNSLRQRQQSNHLGIIQMYDNLVETLQAEVKRRDERIETLEREVQRLSRGRNTRP